MWGMPALVVGEAEEFTEVMHTDDDASPTLTGEMALNLYVIHHWWRGRQL